MLKLSITRNFNSKEEVEKFLGTLVSQVEKNTYGTDWNLQESNPLDSKNLEELGRDLGKISNKIESLYTYAKKEYEDQLVISRDIVNSLITQKELLLKAGVNQETLEKYINAKNSDLIKVEDKKTPRLAKFIWFALGMLSSLLLLAILLHILH